MIFGVQTATSQESAAQSVTLTPRLLKLLQEAMTKAGLDPKELHAEPSNFQQLFGDASAAAAAPAKEAEAQQTLFAPKYKAASGFDSITGMSWKMNENYFADQDTANWVAAKYGTGVIRESDVLGPGAFSVDTKMFEVELPDGRWVNAGVLAAFFDRNPEALFPGLADKLIRSELDKGY